VSNWKERLGQGTRDTQGLAAIKSPNKVRKGLKVALREYLGGGGVGGGSNALVGSETGSRSGAVNDECSGLSKDT
jgi:hypothetical protein